MAGTWGGFTEDEIGFHKNNGESADENEIPKKKCKNRQDKATEKVAREKILNEQTSNDLEKVSENAKLLKDVPEVTPLIGQKPEETKKEEKPSVVSSNPVRLKVIEGKAYELVDRNSTDVSKATLDVFEARQKMLEEQNRRRKEVLAKVIFERKKQTTEEAKRLQHIQKELQKLDMLLSNDVGILRNKIEEASLDFAAAQKRYNKAEKEFLDAKQNLFVKLEKKELLTKLLCGIIEQNELRKAQKLSELMEKLNINETANSAMPPSDCQSALKDGKEQEVDLVEQPS